MGGDDFFRSIAETDETANEPPSDRPLGTAARRAAATRSATPPEPERPEVASSAGSTEEVVVARPPDARPARRLPRRRESERGSSPPPPSGDAEPEKPSKRSRLRPWALAALAVVGLTLVAVVLSASSGAGSDPAPASAQHHPTPLERLAAAKDAQLAALRSKLKGARGDASRARLAARLRHARQQSLKPPPGRAGLERDRRRAEPLPRPRGAVAKPGWLLDRAVVARPRWCPFTRDSGSRSPKDQHITSHGTQVT